MAATILFLHYEAATRLFLTTALADEGYRVVAADAPDAALELTARERPALVVSGTVPAGDFGRRFAREYARRPGPRTPVLLLTTEADRIAVAAAEGVSAVLPEPFDLDDLLATVTRLLPPTAQP